MTAQEVKKYFDALEISIGASLEEAHQAYRDLINIWHPDRFQNNSHLKEKAEAKTKQINEAYQKVRNYILNYASTRYNEKANSDKSTPSEKEKPKESYSNQKRTSQRSKIKINTREKFALFLMLILLLIFVSFFLNKNIRRNIKAKVVKPSDSKMTPAPAPALPHIDWVTIDNEKLRKDSIEFTPFRLIAKTDSCKICILSEKLIDMPTIPPIPWMTDDDAKQIQDEWDAKISHSRYVEYGYILCRVDSIQELRRGSIIRIKRGKILEQKAFSEQKQKFYKLTVLRKCTTYDDALSKLDSYCN